MAQTVSSMQTSINTTKLPSVWNRLNYNYMKTHLIGNIVDYGAGRYQTTQLVEQRLKKEYGDLKVNYLPYDPYWGTVEQCDKAMKVLTVHREADLCVCANVLNVIDDEETVKKIIRDVTRAGNWVIQIYPGDGSGVGKYTKKGTCYQANQKIAYYVRLINEVTRLGVYYRENYIYSTLGLFLNPARKQKKYIVTDCSHNCEIYSGFNKKAARQLYSDLSDQGYSAMWEAKEV